MSKKRTPRIEQLSSESKELLDVLNNEQDLSVILIGASFLDTILSSILERKFLQSSVSINLLKAGIGALGSFAARADICYVLKLIEKSLYNDLRKIAQIRNEIAHYHLALNFDAENVNKLCGELHM
jgi:mannitol operon repressor